VAAPAHMPTDAPPLKVSFCLFAYRQEGLVREACLAALAQDWGPLEAVFSDDASPDGTFAVMEAVAREYRGPHRIVLNRNERNLGLVGHVNRLMTLATGELILVAAGDDVSLPERARLTVEAYRAGGGRVVAVHSAVEDMDPSGRPLGVRRPRFREARPDPDRLCTRHALVIGATHAWSARLFREFGPIAFPRAFEDLVVAYRAALVGELAYVDQPLVRYRVDQGMSSRRREFTAQAELRAFLVRRAGVRLDTLLQREADNGRVGRAVPERLRRAARAERARLALFQGRPREALGWALSHPATLGALLQGSLNWAGHALRTALRRRRR